MDIPPQDESGLHRNMLGKCFASVFVFILSPFSRPHRSRSCHKRPSSSCISLFYTISIRKSTIISTTVLPSTKLFRLAHRIESPANKHPRAAHQPPHDDPQRIAGVCYGEPLFIRFDFFCHRTPPITIFQPLFAVSSLPVVSGHEPDGSMML